ncbi:MAG: serine O-acetyltransferase EpsC [Thermoplasmata archaeon]
MTEHDGHRRQDNKRDHNSHIQHYSNDDIMKKEQGKGESSGKRNLTAIADALSRLNTKIASDFCKDSGEIQLPSYSVIVELIEKIRSILFPGYFGVSELDYESMRFHIGSTLDLIHRALAEQIRRGLLFGCDRKMKEDCSGCASRADEITLKFLHALPRIQQVLATDVNAAYIGDPAAKSPDEAIFCYPGIVAITYQRVAHELLKLGVPLIPRMITEKAHSITGIDIHPGAEIGESFFIDHGTGVVIGETCIIGNNVKIYQGVTLGAKSFPKDANGNIIKGIPRHPIVEDDVVIYAGATILGRITIGKGSVIGGNVWLTTSVPPGSRITQSPSTQDSPQTNTPIQVE